MSDQGHSSQLCNLNWPSLHLAGHIPKYPWTTLLGSMNRQKCHNRLSLCSRPRSTKKEGNQWHFHGTTENDPLNLPHFPIFHGCSFSLNLPSFLSAHSRLYLLPLTTDTCYSTSGAGTCGICIAWRLPRPEGIFLFTPPPISLVLEIQTPEHRNKERSA